MFLAAESIHVGSCWIHAISQFFNTQEGQSLKSQLNIPVEYNVYNSGAFGYKVDENVQAPPRKQDNVTIVK